MIVEIVEIVEIAVIAAIFEIFQIKLSVDIDWLNWLIEGILFIISAAEVLYFCLRKHRSNGSDSSDSSDTWTSWDK